MEYPKALYLNGDGTADCIVVNSLEEELACEGYAVAGQEPITSPAKRERLSLNKE